ncbi:MAG TPA: RNA polymerase sigma factor [Candidatus Baltobacteraceae bacterium]
MRQQVPVELIDAARNGGSADVERLLEAIWPDAYRLAGAIVAQTQSAEDIAQEACVIMLRSIASLRDSNAFRTWFYRIVVREALKHKKTEAATTTLGANAAYSEDCSTSIDIWHALGTLPEYLRTVIVLHYFENLSGREIADLLRIPDATVRFRLMTARRRLQPLLQEHDSSHSKGEGIYAL